MVKRMSTTGATPASKKARTGKSGATLTAVEREIIRAAMLGHIADFEAEPWQVAGPDQSLERPTVSGDFLSRLWQGSIEGVLIHPRGLIIRGLKVEGTIDLSNIRVDGRLRTPLPGFQAANCDFPDGIGIPGSRIAGFLLSGVSLGQAGGGDDDNVLIARGCECLGAFEISRSKVHGSIDISNAVVDDDLTFGVNQHAGGIEAKGIEVRGAANFWSCTFAKASSVRPVSVSLLGAEISAELTFVGCRIAGSLNLPHVQCESLNIMRSRVGARGFAGAIGMNRLQVRGSVWIDWVKASAGIAGQEMKIGSGFFISGCALGASGSTGHSIDFSLAGFGSRVSIENSRMTGGVMLAGCTAGMLMGLQRLRIGPKAAEGPPVGCDLTAVRTGRLVVRNVIARGRVALGSSQMAIDVQLHTSIACSGFDAHSASIAGSLNIDGCVFGCVEGAIGANLESICVGDKCMVVRTNIAPCLSFDAAKLRSLELYGLSLGGSIGADTVAALSLVDADIEANLTIGDAAGYTKHPVTLKVQGLADAYGLSVGGDMVINGGRFTRGDRLSEHHGARCWNIAAARIGGSLQLSSVSSRSAAAHVLAPRFAGSVDCSRSTIGRNLIITAGTMLHALRPDPTTHGDVQFPLEQQPNVCLSLQSTKIGGTLILHGADMRGCVDLNDSSIESLDDSGGGAWADCGIKPGDLRIDGLTYRNLGRRDADLPPGDGSEATVGSRWRLSPRQETEAVAARLGWLDMQFPGGVATPATFLPQPYEQLAHHYGALGDERGRRQVLVRKRQLQRLHSGLGWVERAVSGLLGLTSNYGYSPGRASLWVLVLIALGTVGAALLNAAGAMAQRDASDGRLAFSAILYAIDVAVPFLELGHDAAWRIEPSHLQKWPGRTFVVQVGEAIYRLGGVVLLSIAVLTFSGVLREKD